jgi:hypothetical protein
MRARTAASAMAVVMALLSACAGSGKPTSSSDTVHTTGTVPTAEPTPPGTTPADGHHSMSDASIDPTQRAAAQLATAAFQDVATAESAGYASSLDTLGCFENAEQGGMGVHYINQALMDTTVDITKPEALVYELDARGAITGLVAHEYIVPVDAWTAADPPSLFGVSFHRHPTLPLWVLHAWLWKDNPTTVFEDWNPAVRLCPDGVPIFGIDLPHPANTPPAT